MRVDGGERLARNLSVLPPRVSVSILRKALVKGGEPIRLGMSVRAPRKPGAPDLADNIGITPGRRGASVAIGPTKDFFYGYFQEFGTSRHGSQSFARPAFDADGPKAIPIITGEIWRALIAGGFDTARGSGAGGGLL